MLILITHRQIHTLYSMRCPYLRITAASWPTFPVIRSCTCCNFFYPITIRFVAEFQSTPSRGDYVASSSTIRYKSSIHIAQKMCVYIFCSNESDFFFHCKNEFHFSVKNEFLHSPCYFQ